MSRTRPIVKADPQIRRVTPSRSASDCLPW
jgi:hypothetical protein